MTPAIYSPSAAARFFGVTRQTIHNRCTRGVLPFVTFTPGRRYIPSYALHGDREYVGPEILTREQAAELLGVSPRTLETWQYAGTVPVVSGRRVPASLIQRLYIRPTVTTDSEI